MGTAFALHYPPNVTEMSSDVAKEVSKHITSLKKVGSRRSSAKFANADETIDATDRWQSYRRLQYQDSEERCAA